MVVEAQSSFATEVFAAAPWGHAAHEIPPILEDYPQFAEGSPAQLRKGHRPLRRKLDASGGLQALAIAASAVRQIHHFNPAGRLWGRTPILSAAGGQEGVIRDFAVDTDGNAFLLESIASPSSPYLGSRLRRIGRDGVTQWSRIAPVSGQSLAADRLREGYTRLLLDRRSRLFLPTTEYPGDIVEMDPASGEVVKLRRPERFSNLVFMNPNGTAL